MLQTPCFLPVISQHIPFIINVVQAIPDHSTRGYLHEFQPKPISSFLQFFAIYLRQYLGAIRQHPEDGTEPKTW